MSEEREIKVAEDDREFGSDVTLTTGLSPLSRSDLTIDAELWDTEERDIEDRSIASAAARIASLEVVERDTEADF